MSTGEKRHSEKRVSAGSILRQFKARYMNDVKTEGGTFDEFFTRLLVDLRTDPSKYEPHIAGLLKGAAENVWNSDPRPKKVSDNGDLFAIHGYTLPVYFNYPDPSNPKEVRKVSSTWATVGQLLGKLDLAKENLDIQQAAYDELEAAAETAMERSGGDLGASLADLADPPSEGYTDGYDA